MRSAVAGKARVHELAKELGVPSKTVLAKLKEMGEFVKSASSTVEAPVARRLREEMAAAATAAAPAAKAAKPAATKESTPSQATKRAAPAAPGGAVPTPPRRGPVPGPPPTMTKPASA